MTTDERALRIAFLQGRAGNEADQYAFLKAASKLLRAYFRNRLRGAPDDVEDLVQETLLALYSRRESYDPMYPLTAWLYAIARYRLADFLRRKLKRAQVSMDDFEAAASDPRFEASDARRDVATLLKALPEKQRTAIRMVKLEERSVRDVAAETGLSESDIKVSVHRGLKSLKLLAVGCAA